MASFSSTSGSIVPTISQGIVLIASIVSTTIYLLLKAFSSRRLQDKDGNPIPDGPTGLPIVGMLPFLAKHPELQMDKWAKKFGSLFSFWIGDQLYISISDPHVVKDLMVTNGAIFSNRKIYYLKNEFIFAHRGITPMPYGDAWRKHRRIASMVLNARAVDGYTDVLDFEATTLVEDLYKYGQGGTVPINPQPHAGRCSLNNMLAITFGTRTDTIDHPLVAQALWMSREFMNCTGPVNNLVDFVPFSRLYNPMIPRAKKLHAKICEIYGGMIKDIDARMKRGEEVPDCLVKTMLQIQEEEQLDFMDMNIMCGAFMIGGVETTAAIMQWFLAIISAYPEFQAKAHEEIDRVVGQDRLPTHEDEQDMPYVHAIIKEVERTHNPFWLATPHTNTEDFTYNNKFIPKGTVLLLNTYTMHHDEKRHANPYAFDPEHYINDGLSSAESANLANPMERDHWMFGVGRRICPGMWVAERETFLAISRILWAFKLEQVAGAPIDLAEYDGASGRSPVPFKIKMIPRHEKVAEILGV